jgi:uncharacterized protein with HEPN domain
MQKDDTIRLRHMLEAAEDAREFVAGLTRNSLDTDRKLQLALVKSIEIMGEAASKVTIETRESLSQIPWTSIVGIRNRLIHARHLMENGHRGSSPSGIRVGKGIASSGYSPLNFNPSLPAPAEPGLSFPKRSDAGKQLMTRSSTSPLGMGSISPDRSSSTTSCNLHPRSVQIGIWRVDSFKRQSAISPFHYV